MPHADVPTPRTPDPLAGLVAEELAATLSALAAARHRLGTGRDAGMLVELSLDAAERTDVALAFAATVDPAHAAAWERLRRTVAAEADTVVDAVPC